jgi:Zn-dependent protease/CBS domain-containing protein
MRRSRGLRLGSIAGIDIAADPSLLIIFFLITFSLAEGVFPTWHPAWATEVCWLTAGGAAVLFFVSVLTHELSHALVGRVCGVEIRQITLFMFGGVAQMEGEPPSWRAELGMAIVGPLTSLVLGILFLALEGLVSGPLNFDPDNPQKALAALGPIATLLLWLGPVNIVLGLFNLVPGFPLDGGRVLRAIMWGFTGNLQLATRRASIAGQAFAWLLMSSGVLMILGLSLPLVGGGLVNGVWLAFIGWYLNNAALLSYQQLLIHDALEQVPARKLMRTRFLRVDPEMRISTLANEQMMASGQRAFPVEAKGRLVGMVSLRDLQKADRTAWDTLTVGAIMTPAARLAVISPEEGALEALQMIGRLDVSQLPVVRDGELLGLLGREDVLTWLSLHPALSTTRSGFQPPRDR